MQREYDKENNGRRKIRILACKKYYYENKSVIQVAQECSKCKNWVYKWITRFYDSGLDGLYDLPRVGRLHKVSDDKIKKTLSRIKQNKSTLRYIQQKIDEKTNVFYNIKYLSRKMNGFNLTPKTGTRVSEQIIQRNDKKLAILYIHTCRKTG